MGMTREKAEAEVNKLGLTGQARAQKINELMGNTASKFEGTEEKKEQPKKKGSILKDIGTAMTNNQFGMGGAAMSNAQPTMQIKKEEQQSIDEIADATGLERDRGLLKGAGTIYSEDMAQDLKNRGVSVSDEYKAKHPEVYDENYGKGDKFQVGDNENKKFNSGSSKGTSYASADDTKDYFDKNEKIANDMENRILEGIKKRSNGNWQEAKSTIENLTDTYSNIDKKYINELPTFMYQRYKNGEFGDLNDPESKKNAQLRLAHFMINGIGTALSNASNVIKGKELEQSDYEKYQNSNLEQGLANRWKVNNAETEEVIKLANKEADNEQDARLTVQQLTRDNTMKAAWNALDQNQKLWSVNVAREIGKMVGDMDISELANFITGSAISGDISKEEVIAVGVASLVAKSPELLEQLPEGGIKNAVKSLLGFGK